MHDDLLAEVDRLCGEIDACYRNGVLGNNGWTADGYPIGGHLTNHSVGEVNGAAWDFAALTGLDYRAARDQLLRGCERP